MWEETEGACKQSVYVFSKMFPAFFLNDYKCCSIEYG